MGLFYLQGEKGQIKNKPLFLYMENLLILIKVIKAKYKIQVNTNRVLRIESVNLGFLPSSQSTTNVDPMHILYYINIGLS